MTVYEKVGRLKPDEKTDIIRVIVDGLGDIVTITRQEAEDLLAGVGSQMVFICVDGLMYLAYAWQVRNLLDKWPWKKAAVF